MNKYLLLLGGILLMGCSKPNYYVFKTVKHHTKAERVAQSQHQPPSSDTVAPSLVASSGPANFDVTLKQRDVLPVGITNVPSSSSVAVSPPSTARQRRIARRIERKYDRQMKRWQERPSADGPATTSLVLGILGVVLGVLGVIFGPIAITSGSRALRIIRDDPEQESNRGTAKAGKILGIIGTVLGGIILIALIGSALSN